MRTIEIDKTVNGYPEPVEGTSEWLVCRKGAEPVCDLCDLYEAEEMMRLEGRFAGIGCHLLHVPDGVCHTPFPIRKNVCVEHPVWDGEKFLFLVVDFRRRVILIQSYAPNGRRLECVTELPLSIVKDCYNLRITISPVILYQYRHEEPVCEILWPEKKTLRLHDTETVLYRDGDLLYCSEWKEEPDYREHVIVRDWNTNEIREIFDGFLCRVRNGIFWKIKDG